MGAFSRRTIKALPAAPGCLEVAVILSHHWYSLPQRLAMAVELDQSWAQAEREP